MCPSDTPSPTPFSDPRPIGNAEPSARVGEPTGSGGILTIDLGAIAANYRLLRSRVTASGAECAAVVKADAYGLGMGVVAPVLERQGCRRFFVALPEEGLRLRGILPKAQIFVFNGTDADDAPEMAEAGLVPVLNHAGQVAHWVAEAGRRNRRLPAALHVDTGMNRLGFNGTEFAELTASPDSLLPLDIVGLISHLACAEDVDQPMNRQQCAAFAAARNRLAAAVPSGVGFASLANSSGIFLGPDYHFDLARPGAALYGVCPHRTGPNPMNQVIRLQGKILQLRRIDTPGSVGYGASHRMAADRRLATVAVGYGDGFLRSLSNAANATIGGVKVPLVGRVSMDLITLDVTGVPEAACQPGRLVDLIGPDHSLDMLAGEAGTIGYEILTALGSRYTRRYLGLDPEGEA